MVAYPLRRRDQDQASVELLFREDHENEEDRGDREKAGHQDQFFTGVGVCPSVRYGASDDVVPLLDKVTMLSQRYYNDHSGEVGR